MSIASELSTLADNKAAIKSAIEAKSPETAPTGDMSQWPTAIASIPSGGGGGGLTGHTLTLVDIGNNPSPEHFYDLESKYLKADGTTGHTDFYDSGEPSPKVVPDVIAYATCSGGMVNIVALNGDTTVRVSVPCLLAGTKILLADGSAKNVEDVGYDDELMVWDFERGRPASAKPLWIKRRDTSMYAFVNTFSSGRVLRTTGRSATGWGHRGFNVTRESFTYFPASVGDMFALVDGVDELVECRKVRGEFDFYNIITAGHFNLYADGVLTSCSLNNYRKFSGRDLRFAECPAVHHPASDFDSIPEAYVSGLHLCEQPASSGELKAYVRKLIASAM